MSSEEEDYMSETFLKLSDAEDLRPGLIRNRSEKRSFELSKKRQMEESSKRQKSIKVIESENREEGLEKPISEDNKGFAMLKKMGFNPGTGLGAKGQGRAEPVKIELKTDKGGLGRKEALKELIEKKRQKWKESQKNAPSVLDFRANFIAKQKEKVISGDLSKSQKSCYNLDMKSGIEEPDEEWFWPPKPKKKDDDEEEADEEEEEVQDELTPLDKLELLTIYLRTNYFYCIWCGVEYESTEDMESGCPGSTKDDH